ncbi:MAG: heparan-alpha-glucosaminide N-acetyltransferase domain-containing protein [Candidatus Xenobiia bacterium LiM19]
MSTPALGTTPPSGRLRFIDAARGLALVLMIQVHTFDFWMHLSAKNFHSWAWKTSNFLGSLSAPLFLLLVGFNTALSVEKKKTVKRKGKISIFLRLFTRGLLIFASGYIFNYIMFCFPDTRGFSLEETLLIVQILHSIGISMCILAVLTIFEPFAVYLCALGALLFALGGAVVWNLQAPDWIPQYLMTLLRGLPFKAYFPVFPWCCFPLAGYVAGRIYVIAREKKAETPLFGWFFMAGACTMLASLSCLVLREQLVLLISMGMDENKFFHMSFPLIIFWTGFVILTLAVLYYILEVKKSGHITYSWLEYCGKASFFLFFFHYLCFRISEAFGFTRGWFQGTLEIPIILGILPLLMIINIFVAYEWIHLRAPLLKMLRRI